MHFKALTLLLLATAAAAQRLPLMPRSGESGQEHTLDMKARDVAVSSSSMSSSTQAPTALPMVPAENKKAISLPIDHFGKFTGNFSNHYWVMDQYYKPGGPVFVYDTGETPGLTWFQGFFTKPHTFFHQYVQRFNGLGILWEHRYYGDSSPFPINRNTTARQMQFLTTENALKDFATFANQLQWKGFPVSPKQTPWVVIGASYAGNRAAWLRKLYPEIVFAAYASSAPMQAVQTMPMYRDMVYRGMVSAGLHRCTQHFQSAFTYIDSQLDCPLTAPAIKQLFLGPGAELASNGAFAETLDNPFYNFQTWGIDATLLDFCAHMDSLPAPASSPSPKHYAHRFAAWLPFTGIVNAMTDSTCSGPGSNTTGNCLQKDPRNASQLVKSWRWQVCTETGGFQTVNKGPMQMGSRHFDRAFVQQRCYDTFPDGRATGLLPAAPRTEYLNRLTGGWAVRPSNTFWTAGERDPWRTLSVFSTERGAPRPEVMKEPMRCGETRRDTVFGFEFAGQYHAADFETGLDLASVPLGMFESALRGWVKCFRQRA